MSTPFYADASDPPSKQAVIGAALKLFAARGIEGTSVRDIALSADFSNPVIFKYFASREALAVQLYERCLLRFSARLEDGIAGGRPFPRRWRGLSEAFWFGMRDNLDAFLYLNENQRQMWPLISPELRSFTTARRVRKLLREGQNERCLDPGIDVDLTTAAILGTFLHLARRAYAGEAIASRERVEALVDRLIR